MMNQPFYFPNLLIEKIITILYKLKEQNLRFALLYDKLFYNQFCGFLFSGYHHL